MTMFQAVMRRLLPFGRVVALTGTLACAEWRVEMVPPAGSHAARTRGMRAAPARVAIADVRKFEALRASPAASAALTLGLLVGAIGAVDVLVRGPRS